MASGSLHHWYHSLYVYNNPRRLQVQRIKSPDMKFLSSKLSAVTVF